MKSIACRTHFHIKWNSFAITLLCKIIRLNDEKYFYQKKGLWMYFTFMFYVQFSHVENHFFIQFTYFSCNFETFTISNWNWELLQNFSQLKKRISYQTFQFSFPRLYCHKTNSLNKLNENYVFVSDIKFSCNFFLQIISITRYCFQFMWKVEIEQNLYFPAIFS